MRRALVVAVAVLALVAQDASGATVSVEPRGSAHVLVFAAAPGERNEVLVTVDRSGTIFVADTGAELVPGAGCAPSSATGLSCGVVDSGEIALGDHDDQLTIRGDGRVTGGFNVRGEDGNDKVTVGEIIGRFDISSPGAGVFDGGAGSDELTCLFDPCTLIGGAGDDRLTGGRSQDGGEGKDTLIGDGGNDELHGGPGDDQLFGDGTQSVGGDDGADLLDGGEGRDLEYGGAGGDDFRAGPGDRIEAVDGKADRISCDGMPSSVRGDGVDRTAGCPRIVRGFPVLLKRLVFYDGGWPYLILACDPYAGHGCSFTAELFGPDGRRIDRFADRERAGRDAELPLRLSRREDERYGQPRSLRVRVVIRMRVEGVSRKGSRRIVIKFRQP